MRESRGRFCLGSGQSVHTPRIEAVLSRTARRAASHRPRTCAGSKGVRATVALHGRRLGGSRRPCKFGNATTHCRPPASRPHVLARHYRGTQTTPRHGQADARRFGTLTPDAKGTIRNEEGRNRIGCSEGPFLDSSFSLLPSSFEGMSLNCRALAAICFLNPSSANDAGHLIWRKRMCH